MSQLEFASRIEKATSNNKFVKNGLFILPNPLHLYGLQMPVLYFYAEVYGLQIHQGNPSSYTLHSAIMDSAGGNVKSSEPRTIQKIGETAVIVEQTSIVTLGTGNYTLALNVTDDLTGEAVTSEGRFQVRMPPRPVSAQDDTVFDEDRAKQERDVIFYVASKREIDMYDSFNMEGKNKKTICCPSPGTKCMPRKVWERCMSGPASN